MAVSDGFILEARDGPSGRSWRARVWDAVAWRYGLSRTFSARKFGGDARAAERAAAAWGREQAAVVRAGLAVAVGGGGRVRCGTADLLERYVEASLRAGRSAAGMQQVAARLRDLSRYCPDLSIDEAPALCHRWWVDWCAGPRRGARTQNNALADLRAFVGWCWRQRPVTGLPRPVDLSWVEKIREETTVKAQFSLQELQTMLRAVDHPMRVRVALGVFLGARRSEVLRLRWDDFGGEHALLRGKGKKERLVPIQDELLTVLRWHRRGGGDHDGFLFPLAARADDGGNLVRRFDAFLSSVRIEKKGRTTHSLRHCYAGLMTATGEPTALLQAYMGHSQSDMTHHYAQMAARYRAAVAEWPRGQLRILAGGAVNLRRSVGQSGRPWSRSDLIALRALWGSAAMATIADELGRPAMACYRRGRRLGLPPRADFRGVT